MDGSIDNGLDDHGKATIYGQQQYHNYGHNGHIQSAPNNNGKYFFLFIL